MFNRPCTRISETPTSALTEIKDAYGNIIELQWDREERFSITLTTDVVRPVFDGSKILRTSGEVPSGYGVPGMYAYNVVDSLCWIYQDNEWVQLDNIVSPDSGEFVETFSNPASTIVVEFTNFRGEVFYSLTRTSNNVDFVVGDEEAEVFLQGLYYANIYQVKGASSKLVSTIKITVGRTDPCKHSCTPTVGVSPNEYVTREEFEEIEDEIEGIQDVLEDIPSIPSVIVRIDGETGLATHTSAEIYELHKQGLVIMLDEVGTESSSLFSLLYTAEDNACFAQLSDDAFYFVYWIHDDGTFDYYDQTVLTQENFGYVIPFVVSIWEGDETASATPAKILEAANNGRVVFLDRRYDGDDSVSRYALSYATPDTSCFYQISDDGLLYCIDVEEDGTYTEYERNLMFSENFEDTYKDEIVQAVIDALPNAGII